MNNRKPRMARGYRLQWEDAQQCHVLLYPEGMVTLDPLIHEILSRCDGTRTPADIAAELQEKKVPGIVRQARTRGWLEDGG